MDDMTKPDHGRTSDEVEARGRRLRSGLVAAGAAAGLTLAGLGMAAAQTDSTTGAPESGTSVAPADAPPFPTGAHGEFHMRGGPDGHGGPEGPGKHMFMGPGIHGEFTTKAANGGYQTIANQMGEVTAVSSSSITVKSEDDYSRTYTVNDNTMVNAGNEGIADVVKGDRVHVTALVVDGKANAVEVHDATQVRNLHDKWAPAPPVRPAVPGEGATTTPTTKA